MRKTSRIIENHMDQICTLQDLIRLAGSIYGDDIPVVWSRASGKEYRRTYRQFYDDVSAVADSLTGKGICKKNIAVMGTLDYYWLTAFLGIISSGNVAVPLDRNDNVLEEKIRLADLYGIYMDDAVKDRENFAAAHGIGFILDMEECCRAAEIGEKSRNGSFLYESAPDDDAMIVFTSGTTGMSKGVVLTNRNIIANTKCGVFFLDDGIQEGGRTIPVLPPTHMLQVTVGLLTPLYYGVTLCFGGGIKYISKNMKDFRPEVMVLVPMVVENLYEKIQIKIKKKLSERKLRVIIRFSETMRKLGIDLRYRLFREIHETFGGKLRTIVCGGSSLDADVIRGLDIYGIQVLEGYGITECSPVISCNRKTSRLIGSVGVKAPDEFCQIKIIDGELCVRGDIVFREYFHNEKETIAAKPDGWFHTGDICNMNDDGYIYITGRKKNLIILSDGNNVSPEEIESYFCGHPYIKSIFVSEHSSRRNCLVASVHPNFEVFEEAEKTNIHVKIKEHIKEINRRLPAFKRIGKVVFYDEDFEKTALGKIRRFKYIQENNANAG